MKDVSAKYLDGFRAASVGANGNLDRAVPPPAPDAQRETIQEVSLAPLRAAFSTEERIKHELHPLDAFPRLLHCASTNQPPPADDQFRFQWFGLFYEGPRQDGFLLKLRLPGGRLRAFQLAGLAEIAQEFAGGCVLCNGQGGLDLPGVPVRAAAEILRRVEGIGMRTLLTGGDCVQAVRGGEHEGLADEVRAPIIYPLVCELEQALMLNRRLADLPDRCEVIFRDASDAPTTVVPDEPRCETIIFQMISNGDGLPEFALIAPGVGKLDFLLSASQVTPACLELLSHWADSGDRSDRHHAGLADFCVGVGAAALRERLARRVGRSEETSLERRTGPDVLRSLLSGVPVPEGRLLSEALVRLAEAAQDHGQGEVRLASRHLYLPRATAAKAAEQALQQALQQP